MHVCMYVRMYVCMYDISISNSGTQRQTCGPLQSRSRDPESIVIQISTWDRTAFFAPV